MKAEPPKLSIHKKNPTAVIVSIDLENFESTPLVVLKSSTEQISQKISQEPKDARKEE